MESGPQLVADSSHIFIHTLGRGASHGDLCAPKGGESKSQPGALASIQTLDDVGCTPSQQIGWHCRCALFQPDVLANEPFCLHPASQSFALWFDVISPPTHLSGGYGVVHNFLMLRSLHISSMILLMKLAPQSLRSLVGAPKIEM